MSRPPFFSAQKDREQAARRRLEQGRHVDVMGAEADAERAQAGARLLVEGAHLLGDLGALDDAEILAQPEGDAARGAAPARWRRAESKSGLSSVSAWLASHRSMRAWTRSRPGPAAPRRRAGSGAASARRRLRRGGQSRRPASAACRRRRARNPCWRRSPPSRRARRSRRPAPSARRRAAPWPRGRRPWDRARSGILRGCRRAGPRPGRRRSA